jgi:hypothetical protein
MEISHAARKKEGMRKDVRLVITKPSRSQYPSVGYANQCEWAIGLIDQRIPNQTKLPINQSTGNLISISNSFAFEFKLKSNYQICHF